MSYQQLLLERAAHDDALVVLTAENRSAIRDLPARLGDRFVDTGIAEMTMIGAAAGLALRGRTPVAHALATFLTMRAFEFIRTDIGIPGLPVTLVGAVPGFLSDGNGPTHQALEDVAIMRGIPGMQVFCPADEDDLLAGLPAILDSRRPTYVRYFAGPAAVEHARFELGRAEMTHEGDDLTLLTYGFLLREVVVAREALLRAGLRARVLNVRMPSPIDVEAVLAAARQTRMLVTIEDHFRVGGLYSIVAETLLSARTAAHVVPIALDGWFRPGRLPDVLRNERFTGAQLADRVLAHLG